jgi:ribosomal protein S18 acetylase RimI-like enzyme
LADSICCWRCPEDWSEWSQWLTAGPHARNRWRLPVLMAGILFAQGRRTVTIWRRAPAESYHAKYRQSGAAVGFIIVKGYWNLSHLFVLPSHQRRGIGRALLQSALTACRNSSPRGKLQLNSSNVARGFYTALGFTQTGLAQDKPGGCVPMEYDFRGRGTGD